MTVYSVNLGIGWASSGVEYAQAYRAKMFKSLGVRSKFIFTDFIAYENISHLTKAIGMEDDQVIWLYSAFTDQNVGPTTVTLDDIEKLYHGEVTRIERAGRSVKFFYEKDDVFLTAYLVSHSEELVHRVEYVSRGNLIRKDFFQDRCLFTEYYTPRENRAHLYQRRFFNSDGSVAYDEIIDGKDSLFRFKDKILYSKEELVAYLFQSLELTCRDIVILDRSTGIGQAVFEQVKPAKLAVVVHAEHFSENGVTDQTILWNNFYEYQFTNADKVDVFITSTDKQSQLLAQQFATYTTYRPFIVTIPVGSIDNLKYPVAPRRPYSIVTASRLALEKHVDWLIRAVVLAKQMVPELTFDIYGAGGEESKLRKLIDDNQAQDYIRLCGHQDLTQVYQNYQLYLSASKSEGFGLSLLEAIGSGLPIVGFDVRYGNQTFIKDGENGYLIPPFEMDDEAGIVAALAEKISLVFDRVDLTFFHQTSYDLAKNFLTNQVEVKWQKLVEDLTHD